MKKYVFFLLIGALTACKSGSSTQSQTSKAADKAAQSTASATKMDAKKDDVPQGPITTIKFDENVYDFGTVPSGEKVKHVFKFTNTGNEPLVIENAKGSCGCTVADWPREPIPPGKGGEITVVFDSKGKSGKVTKRVTITANTDPKNTFLTITGIVEKKDQQAGK